MMNGRETWRLGVGCGVLPPAAASSELSSSSLIGQTRARARARAHTHVHKAEHSGSVRQSTPL